GAGRQVSPQEKEGSLLESGTLSQFPHIIAAVTQPAIRWGEPAYAGLQGDDVVETAHRRGQSGSGHSRSTGRGERRKSPGECRGVKAGARVAAGQLACGQRGKIRALRGETYTLSPRERASSSKRWRDTS